jgi:hypothetical protein
VFTESEVTFDSVPGVIAVSAGPVRLALVDDCVFVPLVD